MTLNTTPGADCEALATALQADAYHEARGNAAAWMLLDQTRKEQLLRQAYDRLFSDYAGQWPDEYEFGAADLIGTIPARLRDACALLALYAMTGPLDAPPSIEPQLIEKTTGPITKKFATQAAPARRTFPDVARMVAPFLAPAMNPYSARLVRA